MQWIIILFFLFLFTVHGQSQPVSVDRTPSETVRFFSSDLKNELGFSALPIGNFNGDALLDYAIADPSGEQVFIVTPRTAVQQVNVDTLFFTRNGFTVNGNPDSDFGFSLSAIGDFNQDGLDDLAIGAPFDGNGGRVYILAGSTQPRFQLSAADEEAFLLIVEGQPGEILGTSIGREVNLNQDRFTDLLLASEFRQTLINTEPRLGAYHVIYGDQSFTPKKGTVDVLPATRTLSIIGSVADSLSISNFGTLIEPVGDVTGDGREDIAFFDGLHFDSTSSGITVIPGGNTLTGTQPIERLLFPVLRATFQVFSSALQHNVSAMAGLDTDRDGSAELIVGFANANVLGGAEPKGAVAVVKDVSGVHIDTFQHPNVDWYAHWKTGSFFGSDLAVFAGSIAIGAPFADSLFGKLPNTGAVYLLAPQSPSGTVFTDLQSRITAVTYGAFSGGQFGSQVTLFDPDGNGQLDLFTNSVGDSRANGIAAVQFAVTPLRGDFDFSGKRSHRDLMILSNFWRVTEPAVNMIQEENISAHDILLWKENASIR